MFSVKLSLFLFSWYITATHTQNINKLPCVPIKTCSHLNQLKNTKRGHYGTINLLNILDCEPQNNEIYVKCMNKNQVANFMKGADLLPDSDNCGVEYPENKISGGDSTNIEDFPWIALLEYKTENSFIFGCHGTLISKRYVLTAAHCVDLTITATKGKLEAVVLGDYDITNDTDCYDGFCVKNNKKRVLVESYHIHPYYNNASFANDIALIRLNSEIEYTEFIKPICLPPVILIPPFNEDLYIAGWGVTDRNVKNKIKVKANFELKEMEACQSTQKPVNSQFCAVSKSAAKTCPGDSGAPLMMRRQIKTSIQLYLIGVNSLGSFCFYSTKAIAVHTQVAPYISWILETMYK